MISTALATALLASSAGFLDDVATDWEAGARTRVSTQTYDVDSATTEEGEADLELTGSVAVATPVFRLELTYEPVVSAYTPVRDPLRLFRQRGVATARWDLSPLTFAEGSTEALHGDMRLTRMPSATESIERVPHALVVRRTSFSQALGAERRVATGTRRARLEYLYDRASTLRDGASAVPPSDEALPPQHTVRGALEASWNVRPLDALGARLEGNYVDNARGGKILIGRALATLLHDLGLQRTAWAGLGATLTRETGGSTSAGAVAELGAADPGLIRGRATGRIELSADTRVDRLSGETAIALEGRTAVAVPIAARWRSEAAVAGAAFVSGVAEGTRIVSGQARVVWTPSGRVELAAGYYGLLQTSDVAPNRVRSHAIDLSVAMRFHSFVSRMPPPGMPISPLGR